MCDEWMPGLRLPLSIEQFWQLPRNPAYKYEYIDGHAYLSPRPKHYHAILTLADFTPPEEASDQAIVRPFHDNDRDALVPIFSGAFHGLQPFGGLEDDQRQEAARACLHKTWTHGDGLWIPEASFVAQAKDGGRLVGGVLPTLLPEGDPCDFTSYYWKEPPPADLYAQVRGQPHLTWIFVAPWYKGDSIGSSLLTATVDVLRRQGYTTLLTTFLLGNDSTLLWHWRNGFRLLSYPGSQRNWRRMRRRLSQ